MAEYKIIKTVAAVSKSEAVRTNNRPFAEIYEIYHKVFWFCWKYVDYEHSEGAAVRNVDRRLGRSPAQLEVKEAMKRGPEEIGRYKG